MEQRNLILAIAMSVAVILVWQIFIEGPQTERARQLAEQQQATAQQAAPQGAVQPPAGGAPAAPTPGAPAGVQIPGIPSPGQPAQAVVPDRASIVGATPRVRFESPRLHGSISTKGAVIDDVTLAQYRETTDPKSKDITLLSPSGTPNPYFAQFGWVSATPGVAVPGPDTVWSADRQTVGPGKPVTLSWNNGAGLKFKQIVALDENYMFTVTQRVENGSGAPVSLFPYGLVSRTGTPKTLGFYILHEGPLGVFNGTLVDGDVDYDDLKDAGTITKTSTGGWIGITDKYWLAALVPDQRANVEMRFKHFLDANKSDKYQVDFRGEQVTVAAGGSIEETSRLFAGAKEVRLIDSYADNLGIVNFDLAVDFGWFYYLTKPIFYALLYFNDHLGNFGVAILVLTVLIKLLFFPLANKSYKAMSRLKKLQPKMMEIRERFKDDRVKQNEEMMALYKKENANPAAGCLPILIQIPVFFALYKVLFVSIEMRHAPFFGWIHDLSAPDPLGLLTAFGLVQWNVPEALQVVNIGIWPIIMGLTMYFQQKLNPAPADPMQAKIFMFLPVVFTFLLGSFPAGLVIYWAWNNTLSMSQQWVIMRRMGVTVDGHTVPVPGNPAPASKSAGKAKAAGTKQQGKKSKAAAGTPPAPANDTAPKDAAGDDKV